MITSIRLKGTEASLAALPRLMIALTDDCPRVRKQAAWAIGELGCQGEEAVPTLATLLFDPNVKVRKHAAWALGKIGEKAALATEDLRLGLSDSNQVRFRVLNTHSHYMYGSPGVLGH